MALIAMAVYSTEENKKDECLEQTLRSLKNTVEFSHHRLILSVNAATERTRSLIQQYSGMIYLSLDNGKNLGTAEAINKAWHFRSPWENAVKMDDDVVIHQVNWINELENAISSDPMIGICGLKRKDCWESPDHPDQFYKSELYMLPHKAGQPWVVAEKVNHVMGTCQMYSAELLERIGYLYQPGLYGFDDVFASVRSKIAGFLNVFLPHIQIDHIDKGDTPYQAWKESHASSYWDKYHEILSLYRTKKKSVYYNPFESTTL